MQSAFPATLIRTEDLSDDIRSFTFEAQDGTPFMAAEPGAHIDVHLPGGLLRQYSLWQWDPQGRWGSVAVKREDTGRGGSKAMHALDTGTTVTLTGPRNNFPLLPDAPHSLLIAGGIGATPIYAMAAKLAADGRAQHVYYLTRSSAHAGFASAFSGLGLGDDFVSHYDDRDGVMSFAAVFDKAPTGAHVYVCGPEPLLQAVLSAAEGRIPSDRVHFERFSADASALAGPSDSFVVELAQSGKSFTIPADMSILEVLKDNGIPVDFGCSEGVCGACILDVLEGDIDHRDSILSEEEQEENSLMCICVSRAKGSKLVLDI